MPKTPTEIKSLARSHTSSALKTLAAIAKNPKAPAAARVSAAVALLDRGWGKAVQHIEAEIGVYDSLSFAEKQALLAALESLDVDTADANDANDEATRH
jgi:hypothetical protein